jgi:hypothetical protein
MAFHDIGLFVEYLLSISFSGKKLHSGEQKEKNDQNKKKYELKPKALNVSLVCLAIRVLWFSRQQHWNGRAFPHYFGKGAWAFEIGNFSDILSKLGILKSQCFMTQFF